MPPTLPIPCTLDQFIAFTSWYIETPLSRQWMKIALDFYQETIPLPYLHARAKIQGPWSLPKGNALKLSELMQAIDFTHPVTRVTLHPGQRFKRFINPGEPDAKRPPGHWFAELPAVQKHLALPADQTSVRSYVLRARADALRSTVSDAFTWLAPGIDDSLPNRYFRGSGQQFFIWNTEPLERD